MREVMKKTYIKPAVYILDAKGSLLLVGSLNENPKNKRDNWHNSARGGGFFEDEYEDADDDFGW